MTSSASSFQLKHEYDGFLFATVGEDKKGMLLSVISVLARLDVDPWQEAAALTDLPKETATRRLASLIAKLPADQSDRLDGRKIAARLVALLPSKRVAQAHEGGEGGEGAVKRDPRIAMFVFFAMSMLVAFSLSIHQTPPAAPHASAVASTAASPKPAHPARPAIAPQPQKTGKS